MIKDSASRTSSPNGEIGLMLNNKLNNIILHGLDLSTIEPEVLLSGFCCGRSRLEVAKVLCT